MTYIILYAIIFISVMLYVAIDYVEKKAAQKSKVIDYILSLPVLLLFITDTNKEAAKLLILDSNKFDTCLNALIFKDYKLYESLAQVIALTVAKKLTSEE